MEVYYPSQRYVDIIALYKEILPTAWWRLDQLRDKTELFLRELYMKLLFWENLIIGIVGPTGYGKSLLAQSLAILIDEIFLPSIYKDIKKEWKWDPEKRLAMGWAEARELVEDIGDEGYCTLIVDETAKLHGVGSMVTMDAIKNIIQTMRIKLFNIIIVGTRVVEGIDYKYILIVKKRYMFRDIHKTDFISAEVWVTSYENPRAGYRPWGMITLPAPSDEIVQKYLKARKMKAVKEWALGGGYRMTELERQRRLMERLRGREEEDLGFDFEI